MTETKCPEIVQDIIDDIESVYGEQPPPLLRAKIAALPSIAAERAEREAWERHCPYCMEFMPHRSALRCNLLVDAGVELSFDHCPLRPKNVASSNSHDRKGEA